MRVQPGPIPGMRPPMGAGAVHQANQKGGSSMGVIMTLYSIGIVAFFVYTIMKVIRSERLTLKERILNKQFFDFSSS